jgi:paraquat-inducible protein A
LRECRCCGLAQDVPPLLPNTAAVCARCGVLIRRARANPLGSGLALSVSALILLVIVSLTTLMRVETAGISAQANLFSGPQELTVRGMPELAAAVLFTTVLAPFGKLLGTIYVLTGLRRKNPPRHLRQLFVWVEWLAPWSMIEVFVFGVFVAYVKLGDLVHITLENGLYALLALTVTMIWADAALDRSAVWDELDRRDARPPPPGAMPAPGARSAEVVACEACGLVHARSMEGQPCVRCYTMLHERKPGSLSRCWALVSAAAVMYVPANLFPVLTVVQNGAGAPSTIMGGVEELIQSRMYPLAGLVFFASVLVPMIKVVGLVGMLILTQTRRDVSLRQRTRLYLFVVWIGRWSMIDIFMEALLGALVRFGAVVTIVPGMGAIAFCSVVILTMLAAESFDPRLMWDAAEADGAVVEPSHGHERLPLGKAMG